MGAICVCECLRACMLLSAWCVMWDIADAKVALGWRTHQLRETKHVVWVLLIFFGETKMYADFCDTMATFKIKRQFSPCV